MLIETADITKDTELEGGMTNGLVRDNVFVNVILNVLAVGLRNVQNLPPSAVAVEDGNVKALNPVLLK